MARRDPGIGALDIYMGTIPQSTQWPPILRTNRGFLKQNTSRSREVPKLGAHPSGFEQVASEVECMLLRGYNTYLYIYSYRQLVLTVQLHAAVNAMIVNKYCLGHVN